ncbi:MAG TPA: WD40 repeat domain-containing protein [Nonomuraea sp.]|nr:WD40 repeat domain-containing protein [Nonomuraea sp.]
MASIKVLCVALALLATACTSAPPEPATSPSPPAEIDRLPSPAPGRQLGPAMYGHADAASGLDVGTVNGRPVVVTGGGDGLLRIWDLATHELVGAPLPTGQGVLYDVMIMRRDNRDVAVTNGDTLRVWDLGARRALTPPMDTKALLPRLLAVGSAVGTQVALTENSGGEVQRWNLTAGQPLGDPLKGSEGRLQAGAIGRFGDTTVAVTGEEDGVLRAWDLMTGKPVATARTASIEYIHGLGVVQGVVVITGADGGIERWDLATGAVTVQAKDGDSTSVRVDELDGKTVLLVGAHGTLQIVDAATGKAVGHGWDSDDLLDDVAAVGRLGRKRSWPSAISAGRCRSGTCARASRSASRSAPTAARSGRSAPPCCTESPSPSPRATTTRSASGTSPATGSSVRRSTASASNTRPWL